MMNRNSTRKAHITHDACAFAKAKENHFYTNKSFFIFLIVMNRFFKKCDKSILTCYNECNHKKRCAMSKSDEKINNKEDLQDLFQIIHSIDNLDMRTLKLDELYLFLNQAFVDEVSSFKTCLIVSNNQNITSYKWNSIDQKVIENTIEFPISFQQEIAYLRENRFYHSKKISEDYVLKDQYESILRDNQSSYLFDIMFHSFKSYHLIFRVISENDSFNPIFISSMTAILTSISNKWLNQEYFISSNKLYEHQNYFKHLSKSEDILCFSYDTKTKRIVWSTDGYSSDEDFSNQYNDLSSLLADIHPDDHQHVLTYFNQIDHDSKPSSLQFRMADQSDVLYFNLSCSIELETINDRFICSLTHLSNRISHSKDYLSINENIDQTIQQKLQSLEKSVQHAESANQAKSVFISNMSHEIRTPMNSIIGYAHLLEQTQLSEDQKTYVSRIQEASNHLLNIVNDILDLSKIEAGKIIIEKIPFRLDDLLNEIKHIFETSIKSKNLYFDLDTVHCPNFLIGDSNRIKQILINLVGNAIKFTETGGISLVVTLIKQLDMEVVLNFKVKDTGIGMTPKQMKKLFKSFEQADEATSRLYGGTGLGMAISKKLSLLMHGDLTVASNLNDGTEFNLTIPLSIEHDNLEAKQTEIQKPEKGSLILVADDNLLNQKLTHRILTNLGMNVDVCSNGSIALDLAKKKAYDIIILDMQMPIMDGIECAKNIRLFNQKTPIIAMTGSTFTEDKKRALDAGMNDYLIKPIDPNSLSQTLGKWIPEQKKAT